MPVHAIRYNGEFPIIDLDISRSVDSSSVKVVGGGGQAGKNDRLKLGLQRLLDKYTPLADLPVLDPNKLINPNRNREFWDETNSYLVTRNVEITNVTHDGTKYVLTLTRVVD